MRLKIGDEELKNRFFLPHEVARDKAPLFSEQMTKVEALVA
jgi:hypothetical protein